MRYVIAEPCVDVTQRTCAEERPVACFSEGGRVLYIQPDEYVVRGAFELVCPVEATYYEDDLAERWVVYTEDNASFFTETLPGRDAPLGSLEGASNLAGLPVDAPHIQSLPPQLTELADARA